MAQVHFRARATADIIDGYGGYCFFATSARRCTEAARHTQLLAPCFLRRYDMIASYARLRRYNGSDTLRSL